MFSVRVKTVQTASRRGQLETYGRRVFLSRPGAHPPPSHGAIPVLKITRKPRARAISYRGHEYEPKQACTFRRPCFATPLCGTARRQFLSARFITRRVSRSSKPYAYYRTCRFLFNRVPQGSTGRRVRAPHLAFDTRQMSIGENENESYGRRLERVPPARAH